MHYVLLFPAGFAFGAAFIMGGVDLIERGRIFFDMYPEYKGRAQEITKVLDRFY